MADRLRAIRPLRGGGTWTKLLEHVQVRDDSVGRVEWSVAVDSTVNRAHQHAAGARKGAGDGDELEHPVSSQARQPLGRSRGGLTTKGHLAIDGRGLPLSIVLTPGNTNDATAFGQVLDGIRVPRATTGRPRTAPVRVLGDSAYSAGRSGTFRGAGASLPRSPSAGTR
ncbi:transposase [Streptomyces sp. NPDC013187]|uniref:transposase n=1 Tax=Streptomyces sp. NPDC013187 TaxID=3364865 RepID=UPI0036B3EB6A